jgi:hypothetical protein
MLFFLKRFYLVNFIIIFANSIKNELLNCFNH